MYLGVDIGGTKTLVASLSDDGRILESRRFATNHDYGQFLNELKENIGQLRLEDGCAACVGVPGLLDREAGTVHALGNLPWRDKPIRDDISGVIDGRPVIIENDSRLAGLSEARLIDDEYKGYILFVTVSTGIGGALIHDGRIVSALRDMEIGKMPLEHEGKIVHWEEFAGGRGVVERLHKRASEITDPAQWQKIGEDVAYGLGAVCSTLQPEVIILGGGVGAYVENYADVIEKYLDEKLHPDVRRPRAILPATRPDEAVIYGCYELLRQSHANDPR